MFHGLIFYFWGKSDVVVNRFSGWSAAIVNEVDLAVHFRDST